MNKNGKATKKPIIINYFLFNDNYDELIDWVKSFGDDINEHFDYKDKTLIIKTLEGHSYNIKTEYVIIRGVRGEYYPIEKNIFIETYNIL